PPSSTLFPYTTLFRSGIAHCPSYREHAPWGRRQRRKPPPQWTGVLLGRSAIQRVASRIEHEPPVALALIGTDLRVSGPTPQRTLRHTEHATGLDQRDKVPLVSRSDALRAVVVLYSHPATSVLVGCAYSASITPTTIGCNP